MDVFVQVLLWLSATSFAGIGLLFLYDPVRWASTIDVEASSDVGRVDLRATYGGGFLAMGLFWLWCVLDESRMAAGLWSMSLSYGALALGRGLGWLAGHRLDGKMWFFLGFEVVALAACIWCIASGFEA